MTIPVNPAPAVNPVPADPYANKTIAVAVTAITGVLVQWLTTGHFTLGQEGATAIVGGVAAGLVYFVSNWKRTGL